MDAPLRRNHCHRRPAHGAGSAGAVVWLLLFATLFAAFEILHPVADLLHEHAHCEAAAETVPTQGAHAGDGPVRDAHGPVVLGSVVPALSLQGTAALLWAPVHLPDAPFLEPRAPVPISG